MFPSHVITPQKQKDELGRDRTCNPQIRSLMRFHCATSPIYTSYVHRIIYKTRQLNKQRKEEKKKRKEE